ncbi:MAG: hypothetical protein AAAB35_16840 [Phyllobacterium sp.]|uniref:hypothetical protein n=1 Tax=Phyllobacterium sp. TaxID=1871046 RepID=UPI0030F12B5D
MSHIKALFAQRLGEIHPEILHDLTPIEFRAIQQAEVYWELESQDAVTLVTELGHACKSVAPLVFVGHPITIGTNQNCPVIRIPLPSDIQLVIYAKEYTRVRFELKFKGLVRQLANRSDHPTDRSVFQDLLAMRSAASKRMRQVWRGVAPIMRDSRTSPGRLSDFLELINRADLGGEKELIVSLLGNLRGLTNSGISLANIKALVRIGVLQDRVSLMHGGSKRYPLMQQWSRMFDELGAATSYNPAAFV